MSAHSHSTLISRPVNSLLPIPVEERLRRLLVDKFSGIVQLNIKDGRILGYRVDEVVSLTPKDIT